MAADPSADDVAVFEVIVREADRRVRPVVHRLVGDDVDDVLQNAYVRAFRGWSGFEGRSAPLTWLYSIAVRAALDHLRARRRAVVLAARTLTPASTGDIADVAGDAVDLARAVEALPVYQRVVLLLVDGHGLSHGEAATVLGVPPGTIGSRLSRARSAVRSRLQAGG